MIAKAARRGQADMSLVGVDSTVERCINRTRAWRGLATRHDKPPASYMAGSSYADPSSGWQPQPGPAVAHVRPGGGVQSSEERHAGRFLLALGETGTGGGDAGRQVHLVCAHCGSGIGVRCDHLDVAALLTQGLDLAWRVCARKSAQTLELACRVRAPFWWCPVPSAERREHHDVRKARGKVGVLAGAHATVDVASAVDAVRGTTGQRGARGDRVHQVDAGIAVEGS